MTETPNEVASTSSAATDAVLAALSVPPGSPFALLHRAASSPEDIIEMVAGPVRKVNRLAEITAQDSSPAQTRPAGHTHLVLVPYRQISERGLDCPDDGEPLLVMDVDTQRSLRVPHALAVLPDEVPSVESLKFDIDDGTYATSVSRVLDAEIGRGEGANFVLSRSVIGQFGRFDTAGALAAFKRLLITETGAYWTFLFYTGDRYFLGSTPEQHVRVEGTTVSMNPISGTYRYPEGGADSDELLAFLNDHKETDELYMVVDEELKMMADLCDSGIQVSGPELRSMSRLAHTEYYLRGNSTHPLAEILRHTMPAPTVTGSPMPNACRVIQRYEPEGRGYYSGVLGLIGSDDAGRRCLDSVIVIRTAEVSVDGGIRLAAGSTIVRASDPVAEAAETSAKVSGVLRSLFSDVSAGGNEHQDHDGTGGQAAGTLTSTPEIRNALAARNAGMSSFWLGEEPTAPQAGQPPRGAGRLRIAIVDAEDAFTAMLAYQLRSLGHLVTVRPWHRSEDLIELTGGHQHDLMLFGPGPGDPRDRGSRKMITLRNMVGALLASNQPLAGVCLGHQLVCEVIGLPIAKLAEPNQGRQLRVRWGGQECAVGFYNSYAAHTPLESITVPGAGRVVDITRGASDDVIALNGPGLATIQFHPESFLTARGPAILHELVTTCMRRGQPAVDRMPMNGGSAHERA